MKNYLLYFKKQGKYITLTGISDIKEELPHYLRIIRQDMNIDVKITNNIEDIADDVFVYEYSKKDNYVVLFENNLPCTYSGVFSRYRNVLEDAYRKIYENISRIKLLKKTDNDLKSDLKNIQIIEV